MISDRTAWQGSAAAASPLCSAWWARLSGDGRRRRRAGEGNGRLRSDRMPIFESWRAESDPMPGSSVHYSAGQRAQTKISFLHPRLFPHSRSVQGQTRLQTTPVHDARQRSIGYRRHVQVHVSNASPAKQVPVLAVIPVPCMPCARARDCPERAVRRTLSMHANALQF